MAGDEANGGTTLLPVVEDKYGGVLAEVSYPMDPCAFSALLRSSLSTWTLQGKKGVWIKLPRQLIGLAEAAVKEGFWFHHAEKDYLMLVYWIPIEGDTLPSNASHRVGIGAFVINHKKEVLVVQEKTGRFQGQGIWKFPTGVVDEGEYIHDGSVREVKEETGVDTEFVQVLAFRQTHKAFFEKSDLFFICMLKPLSLEINVQETEIEAAQCCHQVSHWIQKPKGDPNVSKLLLMIWESLKSIFLPKLYRCNHTLINLNKRVKLVSSTNDSRDLREDQATGSQFKVIAICVRSIGYFEK